MNKSESKYFNTALRMDEALLSLLEEKDLEYITVKELCSRAGVNRSTFYLHYETISDLVDEAMEGVNKRFLSYFTQNAEDLVGNIHEKILRILFLSRGTICCHIFNSYGTTSMFTARPSGTPLKCGQT